MTLKWTPGGYLEHGIGCLSGPKKTKEKGSTNGSTFTPPFTMESRIPMVLIQLDTVGSLEFLRGTQLLSGSPSPYFYCLFSII